MKISQRALGASSLFIYAVAVCVAGGNESLVSLVAVAAGLLAAAYLLTMLSGAPESRPQWFWLPYILLISWAALSLTWSSEPQTGRLITLIQVIVVGLMCAQLLSQAGVVVVVELAFYIGVFASLLLSANHHSDDAERLGGALGHANDLATVIVGASLFATRRTVLLLRSARISFVAATGIFGVFACCFYLAFYSAGSRRAIIGMAICACYISVQWAFSARTTMRKVGAFACAAALATFAAPLIVESTFYFRLESLFSYLGGGELIREQSLGVRSAMAEEATRLWAEHPVGGVGLDSFRVVASFGTYSHNNFLEVLCTLGFVGLLLVYFAPLMTTARAFKLRRKSSSQEALAERSWLLFFSVVLLVSDLFSVSYYDKINWLLTSVLLGHGVLVVRQASLRSAVRR
ncbi:O-antigen ligase family protein [Arenimonas composti]|uniref:O-antigen ligase family protein n=1 Tax=Arenimonas composti TaxID=370776 RepID=UPI0009DBE1EF|nr:O-antigen ligase family protein [Arenimonas composti]